MRLRRSATLVLDPNAISQMRGFQTVLRQAAVLLERENGGHSQLPLDWLPRRHVGAALAVVADEMVRLSELVEALTGNPHTFGLGQRQAWDVYFSFEHHPAFLRVMRRL